MKVIVAGMSKTGTKSMAAALRELGYSVHDFMEQFEYNCDDWNRICTKGGTTEDFRRMYENVDAVTDVPACYFWDEIHRAFPESKIVLMTRESEDVWFKSMKNQIEDSFTQKRMILMKLSPTSRRLCRWSDNWGKIIFGYGKTSGWTVPPTLEMILKMKYRRHIADVLQNAPKDKLLVFNVKEGWKPLCEFLEKEIPSTPFPRKNVKASLAKDFLEKQKTFLQIQKEIQIALVLIVICVAFCCYQIFKLVLS